MMCDKANVLDDMIMCHSCGDMSLCWSCCFSSHDGHEREKLQNHMNTQTNQLKQWKDDRLPVRGSLTLLPSAAFDRWKALLDQHQARQQETEGKYNDFECELRRLMESSENELNTSNGYKFDFASFEDQLRALQDEHKQCITKNEQLTVAMSKMLQSGDFSGAGRSGILLTDSRLMEFYCPATNTSHLVKIAMNHRYGGCVMAVLGDGRLMVAGGFSSAHSTASEIVDLVTKQVVQGPSMSTERYNACSAMIGGEMYLCGGEDEERHTLSSCEVYRDGKWMPIAGMKVARKLHTIVALDGLLYAIGGYNGINLSSVECYSPKTDSWQQVVPLNDMCRSMAAAAFNGCIYAAGGCGMTSNGKLCRCQRYNPNQNQWERVADMNKGRSSFSLVAFRDKLYALGGDRERSVESYDAAKNEWKMGDITLNTELATGAVVVNYDP